MESPGLFNLFVPTSKTKIPWAGIVTEGNGSNSTSIGFVLGLVNCLSVKPLILIP